MPDKLITTVGDLIEALEDFPRESRVQGWWEGITADVRGVSMDETGTVCIDVDQP